MATKVLSNEFMQNIATEEAWKELSGNFNWSRLCWRSVVEKRAKQQTEEITA